MAQLANLLFPFGFTLTRVLFAVVMAQREHRWPPQRPQAPGSPTGGTAGSPTGTGGNPAAHTALQANSYAQLQQLERLLADHAEGQPVDGLRLAQLAGLLSRTPIGRVAVAAAYGAGARGPTAADVEQVNVFQALRDPVDVVMTLDELCAATEYGSSAAAKAALATKIGKLLSMVRDQPSRFPGVGTLAQEMLAYAPPKEPLGGQLLHRLARLQPERQELPLQFQAVGHA